MSGQGMYYGFDAALREAELFKNILQTSGLELKHRVIDHTNYFLVPARKKCRRELLYYIDVGKKLQGRTVLELDFAGTSCHRIIWDEAEGWFYEFDKLDKDPISEAFAFMEELKSKLGRGFHFGEELPISRDQAESIAREFARHFNDNNKKRSKSSS